MNEALLKAADLIEASTWWQATGDSDEMPDGHYCAITATDVVTKGNQEERVHAVAKLMTYLKVRSIIAWNDTPGRTKDEVVAALRAAAEMP